MAEIVKTMNLSELIMPEVILMDLQGLGSGQKIARNNNSYKK